MRMNHSATVVFLLVVASGLFTSALVPLSGDEGATPWVQHAIRLTSVALLVGVPIVAGLWLGDQAPRGDELRSRPLSFPIVLLAGVVVWLVSFGLGIVLLLLL